MARFKKMAIADAMASPVIDVVEAVADETDSIAVQVAHDAALHLPEPELSQADRLQTLLKVTVRTPHQELGRAAVEAAARLRCRVPGKGDEADRKATGLIARFLLWAAFGPVIDVGRAFTRATVDEYIAFSMTTSERSLRQRRYVLYGAGRVLHPQQFPSRNSLPAPRSRRLPAASAAQVRNMQALIPGLPASLGVRVQALLDLTYGAGARAGDFKTLRGNAISSISFEGRAVAVVSLPNCTGGVRQVPVTDPLASARLIVLAATVGNKLVLAPTTDYPNRNIVNRVSEELRARGLPGLNPIALRNRWILSLAERIPASLLLQLADVGDLRVLADQRKLLPQYTIRHAITFLLEEAR